MWEIFPLSLGQELDSITSLNITTLQFYLAHIELLDGAHSVWKDTTYHLMDAKDPGSFLIPCDLPQDIFFTRVRFQIGVDSIKSVSGAFGGGLDPTQGMYWTWRSGYIHIKIEGESSLSPARDKSFEFHIGGYQFPYNCVQQVDVPLSKEEKPVIGIAIDRLFENLDWQETHHIMSPSFKSIDFAQSFSTLFIPIP